MRSRRLSPSFFAYDEEVDFDEIIGNWRQTTMKRVLTLRFFSSRERDKFIWKHIFHFVLPSHSRDFVHKHSHILFGKAKIFFFLCISCRAFIVPIPFAEVKMWWFLRRIEVWSIGGGCFPSSQRVLLLFVSMAVQLWGTVLVGSEGHVVLASTTW